jgi:DNA polymerase-3 subunit gamma/tau
MVNAADVLALRGVVVGGGIYAVLDAVVAGKAKDAIAGLESLNDDGADRVHIVSDLAEAVHAAARAKTAGPESLASLSAGESARAVAIAENLSVGALSRAWQMLLKGLDEVGRAPRSLTAAEMLLIRMCYSANLPSPDDLVRSLTGKTAKQTKDERSKNESGSSKHVPDSSEATHSNHPSLRVAGGDYEPSQQANVPEATQAVRPELPVLESFADLVALAAEKRNVRLKLALEDAVEPVRFKPGHVELHLLADAPKDLANELGRKLKAWTGDRWMISLTEERGGTPLGQIRRQREAKMLEDARRHPSVQSVMRHFPNAEIVSVKDLADADRKSKKD